VFWFVPVEVFVNVIVCPSHIVTVPFTAAGIVVKLAVCPKTTCDKSETITIRRRTISRWFGKYLRVETID
jgi:hypothetical protein